MRRRQVGAAMAAALGCGGAAMAGPAVEGLGFLEGYKSSYATGVSDDGRAVSITAVSIAGIFQAAKWTRGAEIDGLGTVFGEIAASTGISADGSVVVGYDDGVLRRATRWTSAGPQTLGTLPGGVNSLANGVSRDGLTVVGSSDDGTRVRAIRWTEAGGMQDLGIAPGAAGSEARGANADGSVVVGVSLGPEARAFRWTQAGGMQLLGVLPGEVFSIAHAVTPDGKTVVGGSSIESTLLGPAFRWTAEDGIQSLGAIPGGGGSVARALSADGRTIVGQTYSAALFDEVAFVWTPETGMRPLTQILTDLGIDYSGWRLRDAVGVSADGLTIVGNGYDALGRSQAWIVTIPSPGWPGLAAAGGVLGFRRRRRRAEDAGGFTMSLD
ncbi:MAG: PEP-CTERM sorting domain-containing protein [Phycisphaerales bacterium]|nr:PEP-CTERM sorting domain-containing protein [Phycisphaerales bacterium]